MVCAIVARSRTRKFKNDDDETTQYVYDVFTLVAYLWIDCFLCDLLLHSLTHSHLLSLSPIWTFTLFHGSNCICRFHWAAVSHPIFICSKYFCMMIACRLCGVKVICRRRCCYCCYYFGCSVSFSMLSSSARWWWTTNMWTKFGK